MADIRLAKPVAGTSQNVVCTPEARFVFEFPTDEATLSRNGDNLVITFEDGSTLQLENFYTAYSSQNMPSFSVDGAEISGEDFFTAMNEPDLMPAAGPAGNAGNQSNGNRFHDYVNADLLDGLDRLGGLDIGWPGSDVNPETDGAAAGGIIDHDVTLSFDSTPGIGNGSLLVSEKDWTEENLPQDSRSMTISAPDGVASIIFGGVTIFENGGLTGTPVIVDGGHFEFDFDVTTGRLDYTFVLDRSAEHNKALGNDEQVSYDFTVTVIDSDGDSASGEVHLDILDDAPELSVTDNTTDVLSTAKTLVGTYTLTHSADGDTVTINGVPATEKNGVYTAEVEGIGTVTLESGNVYVTASEGYVSKNDVELTITVTDSDKDTVSDSLTFDMSSVLENQKAFVTTDDTDLRDEGQSVATVIASETLGGDWVFSDTSLPEVANGQLSVDESGNLVYTQTEALTDKSLHHDNTSVTGTDESAVADTVTVTVVNKVTGATQKVEVTINIKDDGLSITETEHAIIIDNPSSETDKAKFDFDSGNAGDNADWVPSWAKKQLPSQGDGDVYDHEQWVDRPWDTNREDGYKSLALGQSGHTVTFSAVIVQYWDNDNPIEHGYQDNALESMVIKDVTNDYGEGLPPLLTFVSTAWNGGESGMAVYSGERGGNADASDGEIGAINGSYKPSNTDWEAIKIDVGEDAYSITITLNSFYNNPEKNDYEKAYVILMKGENIVGRVLLEGVDSDTGVVDSTEIRSSEAFDTVYVVPWGTTSDFLLNGVELGYSYDPVWTATGQVTATGADGVAGYDFGYKDNQKININGPNVIVSVDEKKVSFFWISEAEGNYTRTQLGEATIDDNGNWSLDWYDSSVTLPDDFTLPIIATDGDGDTAELSVSISEESGSISAQSVEHNVTSAATAAAAVGMLAAMPDTVEASESTSPVEEMDDVSITPETTSSVSSTAENAPEIGIDNNTVEASDTLAALTDETAWADDNGGLLFDNLDALDADGLMSFADNLERQTRQIDEDGTDDSAAMNDTEAPESLAAVSGDGVLLGDEEDNQLFGGEGDDYLFGMNGNDYLDGGEGSDYIFAGSGDDVIVYDGSDYLIDGGDGIDFMVSTDEGLSLDKLLTESGRDGNDGPIVNDVEVLITGKDALSLTNTEQLAKEYGITIGTGTNGDETLTLDMSKWQDNGNGSFDYIGQEGVDLTLETNLTPAPDTGDAEVQTQVFILNNTQG